MDEVLALPSAPKLMGVGTLTLLMARGASLVCEVSVSGPRGPMLGASPPATNAQALTEAGSSENIPTVSSSSRMRS